MQHARLSPSSSARWLTCTASVEASETYENKTNSAAEWGTNVHYMGELLLKGFSMYLGDTLQEPDKASFTVDAEMLKCAEEYADYVNSFVDKKSLVLIEEQFDLSCVSKGQFGTSDATVLNGTHLHVFDLKTGRGIVNAEDNTQMMLYAIGAVEELEDIYDIEMITLHIVQTRVGHIDTWDLHYEDLMRFKDFAKAQAKAIIEGETKFNPTQKGCKWCPHQTDCEALKTHVEETIKGAFDVLEEIEGQADKIDTDHMKKILDNAELITGFIKAVQEVALEKMQEGNEIDGYKIIRTRKNKSWINKDEAEKYLVRKLKQSGAYKRTIITPTQAIKALGKDNAKHLEKLFTVPEGDLKVVSNSTKGEAVVSVADQFKIV